MSEDKDKYIINIDPDHKTIAAEKGSTYRTALSKAGIYFPQNCSGKGQCGRQAKEGSKAHDGNSG